MIASSISFFIKKIFPKKIPNILYSLSQSAIINNQEMKFYSPTPLSGWRAKTLFTKEPGTISWIDSFHEEDVFWDIGANVGIYAIYATIKKRMNVVAFEPSPFNFEILSRNLLLNGVSDRVSAYCLAFSDRTRNSMLNMSSVVGGAAHTGFDHTKNEFNQPFKAEYAQSTLGFGIDDFIQLFSLVVPNHIKIDVDGSESAVIGGGVDLLKNEKLRSILVEFPSDLRISGEDTVRMIKESGFELSSQEHPDGFEKLTNYIFKRI